MGWVGLLSLDGLDILSLPCPTVVSPSSERDGYGGGRIWIANMDAVVETDWLKCLKVASCPGQVNNSGDAP